MAWSLRFASPAKAGIIATVVGITSPAAVASAQPTISPGLGGGYTIAPHNGGESPGGSWNAEGFLFVGLPGTSIAVRPTLFSYGRGSTNIVFFTCPARECPAAEYTNASGPERASGLALDLIIPITHGPFVPYFLAGADGVFVTRETAPSLPTARAGGLGLELGGGGRVAVGRMTVFAEVKYFGTEATESRFNGNSVNMLPVTVGITF